MPTSFFINRRPPEVAAAANQTVSPPAATASASAPVPVPQLQVPPGVATASASALVPVPALSVPAPVATANASSPLPVPQLRVLPPAASASASAPVPSLLVGIVVPVATASANGPPPVPQLVVLAPAASASASAPVPTVSAAFTVSPPVATANASAPAPTVQLQVSAPAATAAASAPVPVPQVRVLPPAATAAASAPVPSVGVSVVVPAATASASSPVPVPQLRVSPGVATASASALVPVVTTAPVVSAPAATAAASAPVPTLQLRVSPGAASASASAPVPAVQDRVLPPAATATASAPTPTVTVAGAVQPPITTPLTGLVYGTPASGTITPEGDTGLVIVSLKGVAAQQGDTGYPSWAFPTTRVAVLGYSNQVLGGVVVGDVETLIGRQFHGLRQNQAYTTTGVGTAVTEFDAGRTTSYRSIQFDTAPGGWAGVATGVADSQLTAFCNAVIAANRWTSVNPFLVSLHHEATLSPFGTAGFLAADYKAMWAHCVPLMLATGAPIAFAYVGWDRMFVGANGIGPPTAGQGVADLDPGSSLYTYLGSDPYNAIDSPGVLRYGTNAVTLLEPIRQAAIARGKDWMMGEMGCEDGATTQDHVNKAAWLDSLRLYLDGLGSIGPGVCRVMLTTLKASAENYNVDSSAESIAAWQRLGHDAYYA